MSNSYIFSKPLLLGLVGMAGSGKTEVKSYIENNFSIPFTRFGDFTEEKLKKEKKEINPENEKTAREELRKKLGMDAYAKLAKNRITELLSLNTVVGIDGLYSWEEYKFLKKEFSFLIVIHVFTEASLRHKRLSDRLVRPLSKNQACSRDIAEIENLNKAGPIAIADYILDNSFNKKSLFSKIDLLIERLKKL